MYLTIIIHFLIYRYRKILQVGLSKEYRNPRSDIGKWLHHVFGLTFLHPDEVGDAFSFELSQDMPRDERVIEFADYLTDNYISEDSNFPPYIWAECSADISRTTNCCESFHSKFKNYCLAYHPNIYVFIEALKKIQTDTYIKITSSNIKQQRLIRKQVSDNQNFIAAKIAQYQCNNIRRYDFIKCVSYKFSPKVE
jgi:hypothetical protein